jgi:hypothetical protein
LELFVTGRDGERIPARALTLRDGDGIARRYLTRGLPALGPNMELVGLLAEADLIGIALVDDRMSHLHFHPTRVHPECRTFPAARRAKNPRFAGSGRALVAEIVRRSIKKGYEGHVTTLTAHTSKGFFETLGFEELNEWSRLLQGSAIGRYLAHHEQLYGSFSDGAA